MGESIYLMNVLWPQLQRLGIDMAHMINMGQTAVFYSMHANKMLEAEGTCTVHIKSLNDMSKRCTVRLTIMSSGL